MPPVNCGRTLRNGLLTWTNSIILQSLDPSCAAWSCFLIHGVPRSEYRETSRLRMGLDLITSSYHVGFPVFARISAGFYGSLFFIFVRCVGALSDLITAIGINSLLDRCDPLHGYTELLREFSASCILSMHIWFQVDRYH